MRRGAPPPRSKARLLLASPLALGLLACGPNLASQVARAPEFDRPGEAKCGVTKSQAEPLVVEWPSAARAKLEALSRTGVVAVRYEGCEMEVLASCNAPGKYAYTAINPKHDHVVIRNEDDLYASIPLGAARLESKLARTGELDVDMSMVGRYASDRATVRADELQGPDCGKATHVVSALTVGAFDFSAGAGATVSADAKLGNAGGGGGSQSAKELLNSDGRMSACEAARTSDGKPPEACGAILRLEVVPLGQAKQDVPAGAPQAATQAPTGGLGLVPAGGSVRIDVEEKDQTLLASVEAGGKTHTCSAPVTYYKPCRLTGLPEGRARLKVTGDATLGSDIPISADGATTLKLWHRGSGLEISTGIVAAAGGAMLAAGFLNGPGLAGNSQTVSSGTNITNVLLVTLGGSLLLVGMPFFAIGLFSAHDGVVIQAPGQAVQVANAPPSLQWGGLAAPTTWRF